MLVRHSAGEGLAKKAHSALRRYAMLQPGDHVVVALSGGADSVALFHFLHAAAGQLGITLAAAHFEHGLRGADSRADAAFVQSLCAEKRVPLSLESGDMANRQRPKGFSEESWARSLRYAFLDSLADGPGIKIATAHTASDNAETLLFNAARGSGPRGLAGIPPVRGVYIRPLIFASRADVESYCAAQGLAYRDDATNALPQYSRNRLRHSLLPLLEDAHPGAAHSLAHLAVDMRDLDDFLAAEADALLRAAALPQGGYAAETLLAAPRPLRLYALAALAGPQPSRAVLTAMENALTGQAGAVSLSPVLQARREEDIFWVATPPEDEPLPLYEEPLCEGRLCLPGGYCVRVSLLPAGARAKQPDGEEGAAFYADYDKIGVGCVFRPRREGDTFSLPGRNITKTVKKWMNEAKIPPAQRGSLPLLARGSEVLWAWGVGFCRELQPSGTAGRLLQIDTSFQEEEVAK